MHQLLEIACDIALIKYLIYITVLLFYINLCLSIFIKHEFKLKMFVVIYESYSKWCILIVRSIVPLIDHSVVKVYILVLLSKSTISFEEIFLFRLKKSCCTVLVFIFAMVVEKRKVGFRTRLVAFLLMIYCGVVQRSLLDWL